MFMEQILKVLEKVVANLADPIAWNWAKSISEREAADMVLKLMANNGLIGHKQHPLGGNIWIVNGKLYGRTDEKQVPQCAHDILSNLLPCLDQKKLISLLVNWKRSPHGDFVGHSFSDKPRGLLLDFFDGTQIFLAEDRAMRILLPVHILTKNSSES